MCQAYHRYAHVYINESTKPYPPHPYTYGSKCMMLRPNFGFAPAPTAIPSGTPVLSATRRLTRPVTRGDSSGGGSIDPSEPRGAIKASCHWRVRTLSGSAPEASEISDTCSPGSR